MDPVVAKLCAATDAVALRRVSGERFRVVGNAPAWWSQIAGELADEFTLAERWPFLSAFLPQATVAWEGDAEHVRSGPWNETVSDGDARLLEATAVRLGDDCYLLLQSLGWAGEERRQVLQIARSEHLRLEQDVASRERKALDLDRDRQAAEMLSRTKSEFLAHMSHEIRTPMNGVLAMAELALETDLTADQRLCLQTIHKSAEALLVLVNDLLDLSQVEAGRLRLAAEEFSLREVLDDALRLFAARAGQKGLALSLDVSPETPERLVGDGFRLRQIVLNLVGNAVKFTERGGVVVRAECELHDDVRLRLSVADTGIGISADQQQFIFDPFAQADPVAARQRQGTGLGLTIASRLAQLMGGRLWLESTPGQGSTFFVSCRCGRPRSDAPSVEPGGESQAPADTTTPSRSLRILVAEDDEINQTVARELLGSRGHTACVVDSGRAAVEAATTGEYDVVLLDCQLPDLDGYQVARAIRNWERERARPRVPIVALTAFAMAGDRERCLAAGMDGYLSKPLQVRELLATVARAAGGLPTTNVDQPDPLE